MGFFVLDIETSGLDAKRDFITCIGILTDEGIRQISDSAACFRSNPLRAEQSILGDFYQWCHNDSISPSDTLITYNGLGFDLPFIHERGCAGVLTNPHIDLSLFVKASTSRYVSKDIAASKLGNLYVPSGIPGAYLARAYNSGLVTDMEHLEMLQHNAVDLVTTARLYEKIRSYPDFRSWLEQGHLPKEPIIPEEN